ncbi:unnamed protein product, partial [Amoebophrya sp. A25]
SSYAQSALGIFWNQQRHRSSYTKTAYSVYRITVDTNLPPKQSGDGVGVRVLRRRHLVGGQDVISHGLALINNSSEEEKAYVSALATNRLHIRDLLSMSLTPAREWEKDFSTKLVGQSLAQDRLGGEAIDTSAEKQKAIKHVGVALGEGLPLASSTSYTIDAEEKPPEETADITGPKIADSPRPSPGQGCQDGELGKDIKKDDSNGNKHFGGTSAAGDAVGNGK